MAKKKKVESNNTYEFFTLDRKNVDEILQKVRDYYRKNGRTVVSE